MQSKVIETPQSLKFLHSMRDRESLEAALQEGLMYKNNPVKFSPADTNVAWSELLNLVWPTLIPHLDRIGKPWVGLTEQRQNLLLQGIGTMSVSIPMVCFTEVPEGRKLRWQQLLFGGYGVVVRREWLESHGGDRVLYVGAGSEVSIRLFRVLANLQIAGLHVGQSGDVLFDSGQLPAIIDLLAYIQVRKNLEELEWRIAGHHGITGGSPETGKRVPLSLDQIEIILVQNKADIAHFRAIAKDVARRQSVLKIPRIQRQPETLKGP